MLGVEDERGIDGAAMQLVGLVAVQQMKKVAGGVVVVGRRNNAFAVLLKVVPIEKYAAKAGSEAIGNSDLVAGGPFRPQSPEH